MALSASDDSDHQYRLGGCTLDVTGPQTERFDLQRVNLEEPTLELDLQPGDYVLMLDGECVIEQQDEDGVYAPVDFEQVAPLSPEVQVLSGEIAEVTFGFNVRGGAGVFRPGQGHRQGGDQ